MCSGFIYNAVVIILIVCVCACAGVHKRHKVHHAFSSWCVSVWDNKYGSHHKAMQVPWWLCMSVCRSLLCPMNMTIAIKELRKVFPKGW